MKRLGNKCAWRGHKFLMLSRGEVFGVEVGQGGNQEMNFKEIAESGGTVYGCNVSVIMVSSLFFIVSVKFLFEEFPFGISL